MAGSVPGHECESLTQPMLTMLPTWQWSLSHHLMVKAVKASPLLPNLHRMQRSARSDPSGEPVQFVHIRDLQ